MSLQHAAKHLAAHGRGPDTVLVHMTKGEVKSLNDLAMAHGGHLTVNPKTGLPEAGFLSSILPMALGFALGPAGLGMSQLSAGLLSGAAGMILNPGGGLMGGLMSGLGGYGGAGLGESLAQQGMAAEAQAAQQATEAAKASSSIMTQAPAQASAAFNPTQLSSLGAPPDTFQSVIAQPAASAPLNLGAPMTANGTMVSDLTPAQNANYALQGVKTLGTGEGLSSFADRAGGGMNLAKTGLMAAAPLIADSMKEDAPPEMKTDSDPGQQYKYAANPSNPTPAADQYGRENKYFNPTYTNAAAGGMMASGGISDAYNLGGYSDGDRLLRGPGDGVSDSIPAVIGKKRPARLADGEFVVPARIVSEIGNGSTEAGARKLYAMMDRIQKARGSTVGKGKVAKNSRAERYLPA